MDNARVRTHIEERWVTKLQPKQDPNKKKPLTYNVFSMFRKEGNKKKQLEVHMRSKEKYRKRQIGKTRRKINGN